MNQERTTLETALPLFEAFSEDDFCAWIDSLLQKLNEDPLLAAAPLVPHLELGTEEIDGLLIGLYETLGHSRGRFADAIATLYESTSYIEGNVERIHLLLLIIAAVKPWRLRNTLRGHLLDEIAFEIDFTFTESWTDANRGFVERPEDLHSLLLSVVGEYGKDKTLLEYVKNSASRIVYYPYLLVCFRLISASGDKAGFDFIEVVVPHTQSSDEARSLSLEVREEIRRRTNYRQVCEWYTSKAVELSSRYTEQFSLFEDAFYHDIVYEDAFPTSNDVFDLADDKYVNLLALQLHAPSVRYTAEQIFEIGKLHKVFSKNQIIAALHNIWRRSSVADSDIPPWNYVTVSELVFGGLKQSYKREIEVQGGGTVRFDARQEPILNEIFEQLYTIYLLGSDLEEITQEPEEEFEQGAQATAV